MIYRVFSVFPKQIKIILLLLFINYMKGCLLKLLLQNEIKCKAAQKVWQAFIICCKLKPSQLYFNIISWFKYF